MYNNIFYNWGGLNEKLFILINHITNFSILPQGLQILSSFFFVGNFILYYFLLCIYLVIFKVKYGHSKYTYENFINIYNPLVRVGMCYTLLILSYTSLKFSVNLPRPFCSLSSDQYVTIANLTLSRCLSSFPSAHTGFSIMIVYFIWPHIKNACIKILAILIICAVAISRITLAMHYPSDIIYSIIIIFIIINLSNMLFRLLYGRLINPIGKWLYMRIYNASSG